MSKVYSFSVGEGDMFCINHNSDNFTTIDCCLDYDQKAKDAKEHVLKVIMEESKGKGISRFISTHPDEDHISGLKEYHEKFNILNFYRVSNKVGKDGGDESEDFKMYKTLRDDSQKNFSLSKGCHRKWMNEGDEERKGSGLECLWPVTTNEVFEKALEAAEDGKPNNISPAIKYSTGGFSFLWMGDMETSMQEEFANSTGDQNVTVVFAPHHGRKSGQIPSALMSKLNPKLIVVGEAPSEDLDYYKGHYTITQNTAGDILFETNNGYLDVFVGNAAYAKKDGMVVNRNHASHAGMTYLGSLEA